MRPEVERRGDQETGGLGDEETVTVALTEEENLVMKLLAEKSPVDLNELKGQTGLSNKKWDKAIKGLRKHNMAKVENRGGTTSSRPQGVT